MSGPARPGPAGPGPTRPDLARKSLRHLICENISLRNRGKVFVKISRSETEVRFCHTKSVKCNISKRDPQNDTMTE